MFYNPDFTNGEREFKRAIELNPNYEYGYELYSYLLLSMGRLVEGIRMAQRGLEVASRPVNHAQDARPQSECTTYFSEGAWRL